MRGCLGWGGRGECHFPFSLHGLGKDCVADVGIRERILEYADAWRRWAVDENAVMFFMHGEVVVRL
jgi:hypothetical protein